MEENNIKKTNKGLIVVIVILVIAVLGCGGFIIYDKFIKKDEKECTKCDVGDDKTVETVIPDKYKSVIVDRFDTLKIPNEVVYLNEKFEKQSIPRRYLVGYVVNKLADKIKYYYDVYEDGNLNFDLVPTITYEELNNELSKILLDININEDTLMMLDIYDESEHNYLVSNRSALLYIVNDGVKVLDIDGGDTASIQDYDVVFRNIISVDEKEDTLSILVKLAFARYDSESDTGVSYYKTYNGVDKVETNKKDVAINMARGVVDSLNLSDNVKVDWTKAEPNWNLYNTYKYTFKIVDGTYYFENFELVK